MPPYWYATDVFDDGWVNAEACSPWPGAGRRGRPGGDLVAHYSRNRRAGFVAGLPAECRQRPDNVQRRRMFLLSCGAEPAGPLEAGRRTGTSLAIRDVLRAEHLAGSE